MATRKSRLTVSRADLAALASIVGNKQGAAILRSANRFLPPVRSVEVPESAWHPATQLDRRPHGHDLVDQRGSAEDRRRRKAYLLDTWGDGSVVPCAFCKTELTFDTLTVDRFPIPGRRGGRYTRDNIRPLCGPCNSSDQGRAGLAAITEDAAR